MEDVIVSEIQDGNLKILSANFHSHDNTIEKLLSLLHADYCMMLPNQQQVVSGWMVSFIKEKKNMNELVDVVILWFTHWETFCFKPIGNQAEFDLREMARFLKV